MKFLRIKMLEENSLQIKERMGWIFKLFLPSSFFTLFYSEFVLCTRNI